MSIKLSSKFLILGIIGLICAIFFAGWYLGSSGKKSALNDLKSAKNEILTYKAKIAGDSVTIFEKKQEIVSQKQALEEAGLRNKDLRELNIKNLAEITKLKFKIDTLLSVPHNGQVIVIHDTIQKANPTKAIILPFNFSKKDQWLSLNGSFDKDGLLGVKLSMDVPVNVITGYSKQTKANIVAVTTPNTYINTISVQSYKSDSQKKKRWGIGAEIGWGWEISGNIKGDPFIGFGLSYDLFQF